MEQFAKHLPIAELIAETDAYMVSLGYTISTLRHHRQAWNALKNLAIAKGEVYFTKNLGFELLQEHYKVDPYASRLSEYKSVVRRSVMLLLEYHGISACYQGSMYGRTWNEWVQLHQSGWYRRSSDFCPSV